MYDKDITSKNAILILQCDEIYPSGVQLDHFNMDRIMSVEARTVLEARASVDGKLALGVIYTPPKLTIAAEPCGKAYAALSNIVKAQTQNDKPFAVNLTISIPSQNITYSFKNGGVTAGNANLSLGKTVASTTFSLIFESVEES